MSAVNLLDEDLFLWNEFRGGNAEAFGALVRVHYPDLFQYGTRFTKEKELVKDCLQDLFLELWANRDTISETSFVKYYLLKSLRRRLNKKIGRSRYTGSWEELHFESLFNGSPSIEISIIRQENLAGLVRKMRSTLAGLSKNHGPQPAICLQHSPRRPEKTKKIFRQTQ
jgi:DNA-directed RNA polymerase specialized sigma24 family protein